MPIAITISRTSLMRVFVSFILSLIVVPSLLAADRPLKVFILAGQSNMEGHAKIETFDYIGDDPATVPLLQRMRGADGKPTACDHVWISYYTGSGEANGEGFGKLTAGYGARQKPNADGGKIGPEFTFGLTLDEKLNEPVLIIKTAWGGKSLHTDFRPPSAGPYVLNEFQKKLYYGPKAHGVPEDMEKWLADKKRDTGRYYRLMIEHVRHVLHDIKRVCPAYAGQGYELAGFVWLQGWNDMVDGHTYPDRGKPNRYDLYSEWLSHFIRDVRRDLSAPKMPFVIGVMGVGGAKPGAEIEAFRAAMTAPDSLPEFKGNVTAVPTAPFWSEELGAIADKQDQVRQMAYYLDSKHKDHANADGKMTDAAKRDYLKQFEARLISPAEAALWKRGASNAGYHYLGCAKTFALMGQAFAEANLLLLNQPDRQAAAVEPKPVELAGYLLVPHDKVNESYNAGFSMYVSAWPLLRNYPGQDFQSGLFGTWMFAQFDGPAPKKHYSDIEGGLGWWRDTRFATETPKFIMGGVALEFSEWANGPGAGKGRDWKKPAGNYAVAQLSPWVLWPPDGLNLKQGTCGELFGYGYLPLPLTSPKKVTAGKDVLTGNHCWALFLNTGNFKGPATCFLPYFWSKPSVEKPELSGLFLDSLPSEPNKAVQMETQHIPAYLALDAKGVTYARIAPTQFPGNLEAGVPLVHRITAYNKSALWDRVQAWFDGGAAATGQIASQEAAVHNFPGHGGATWEIYPPDRNKTRKAPLAWSSFASPTALDDTTFGYRWSKDLVTNVEAQDGSLITLPEYYRLEKDAKDKERWVVVSSKEVPPETGLSKVEFPRARRTSQEPYVTPDEPNSCWMKPGPVAGPFKAHLGDGSLVTYSWYRFADQPALLNADLTDAERESLQKRVELLHRTWTKKRDYLPPPTIGTLADLDPAVIVTPPQGLAIGYVPIVTRQELEVPR